MKSNHATPFALSHLVGPILMLVTSSFSCATPVDLELDRKGMFVESGIVDGFDHPQELDEYVAPYQLDAIVHVVVPGVGECSGVLVGEKIVVTAAHCAVENLEDWWGSGDLPVWRGAGMFEVHAGPERENPSCRLSVEEVRPHAMVEASFENGYIQYDFAVLKLTDSFLEACSPVMPVFITEDLENEEVEDLDFLQGGYGLLNHAWVDGFAIEGDRQWAKIRLAALDEQLMIIEDIGTGFPTHGDSGAGVFIVRPNGELRVVGINSTAITTTSLFSGRIDLLETELYWTDDEFCSATGQNGYCHGEVLIQCSSEGFEAFDCSSDSEQCVVGPQGAAECKMVKSVSKAANDQGPGCSQFPAPSILALISLVFLAQRQRRSTAGC